MHLGSLSRQWPRLEAEGDNREPYHSSNKMEGPHMNHSAWEDGYEARYSRNLKDYEHCRDSHDHSTKKNSVLRDRPLPRTPLPTLTPPTNTANMVKISGKPKTRGNWIDEDLIKAIDCYDLGYKINDCVKAFHIPRSSLRNHLSGKTKTRKIGPKIILTKQEEGMIITYIDEMLDIGQPSHLTC